eukprot:11747742-Alexandrium_andersonii.AAC.1
MGRPAVCCSLPPPWNRLLCTGPPSAAPGPPQLGVRRAGGASWGAWGAGAPPCAEQGVQWSG